MQFSIKENRYFIILAFICLILGIVSSYNILLVLSLHFVILQQSTLIWIFLFSLGIPVCSKIIFATFFVILEILFFILVKIGLIK